MNSTHRIVVVLAAAALLAGTPDRAARAATDPGCPAAWDGDQQQTEKFTKTVPLPKGGSLDLSNISGDIVITGGAGDQVVIEAVKRGKTAEDLKLVQVEVVTTATRVEVRTQYPRERRNFSVSVDYTVSVPRAAGATVRSVSGDLKVLTVDGLLAVETVSGDVTIGKAGQLESAKSVSGNVVIDTAGSEGDLSVSSVSGDVSLKSVKARGLEANSVSGNVELKDVGTGRLRVKSVSGDLVFGGPLTKGGRYSLQSHSGDVTVYTDGSTGFEMAAGTFSGNIESDVKIVSTFGGDGQRVHGTFGDGGAFLELGTFSGDVKIVSKTATKAVKK
jgi:DUF4097 and DUF4098 domain-containing protein YvlB